MSDRVANAVIFVGIVAIIGGSTAVMLSSGAPILKLFSKDAKPAPAAAAPGHVPVQRAEPAVEPAQPTPVSPALQLEASQRMTPGVYRCQENGKIIYASQPCVNGQQVKSRRSDGSNATSVPKQSGQPAAP